MEPGDDTQHHPHPVCLQGSASPVFVDFLEYLEVLMHCGLSELALPAWAVHALQLLFSYSFLALLLPCTCPPGSHIYISVDNM